MSNFHDVGLFHQKFGLENVTYSEVNPRLISNELVKFRLEFLKEELVELAEAYGDAHLPRIADALVDLVYVALGTAHLHGLPWDDLFAAVHQANMRKTRAQRPSDSARGSTFDVVKPPSWQPPDILAVLQKYGYGR